MGFAYIDPRWSTEQVLAALSETEILLTEAMHGAIVADALRVSWIPIRTTSKILAFKWQDWCQSVGLEYTPHRVLKLEDPTAKLSLYAAARYQLKIQVAATQLGWIAGRVRPTLSNEQRLDRLTSEVWQRLQQFQQDLAEGRFALSPSETESLVPTLAGFSYEI
jgi:succinoglycan biosynthesis protein ExoV